MQPLRVIARRNDEAIQNKKQKKTPTKSLKKRILRKKFPKQMRFKNQRKKSASTPLSDPKRRKRFSSPRRRKNLSLKKKNSKKVMNSGCFSDLKIFL